MPAKTRPISNAAERAFVQRCAATTIRPAHLERPAIVYVRQSSPQQIGEHRESLARQYALEDHAQAFGWHPERILVIDEDLGLSARTADNRRGSRPPSDWSRHRFKICTHDRN